MIFLTEHSSKVSVLHITHFILFLKSLEKLHWTLQNTTRIYRNLTSFIIPKAKKVTKIRGSGVCMHTPGHRLSYFYCHLYTALRRKPPNFTTSAIY